MTAALTPFDFHGSTVRVVTIDGEPWFVLADLVRTLGLAQFRADRLDDGVTLNHPIIDSLGRTQQATIVSEAGMYEVVIRSDKPEAITFRRWITSEVLPAIRRHGGYLTPAMAEQVLTDPDTIIRLATDLKAERAKRAELDARVEADRPLVAQATAFRQAEGLHTIGDVANALKVWAAANLPGVKVLHEDVWDIAGKVGLVIRGKTVRKNQPTSQAIEAGWVKPKDVVYETDTHGTQARTYTRLTPAGYGRLWDACIAHYTKKAAA